MVFCLTHVVEPFPNELSYRWQDIKIHLNTKLCGTSVLVTAQPLLLLDYSSIYYVTKVRYQRQLSSEYNVVLKIKAANIFSDSDHALYSSETPVTVRKVLKEIFYPYAISVLNSNTGMVRVNLCSCMSVGGGGAGKLVRLVKSSATAADL